MAALLALGVFAIPVTLAWLARSRFARYAVTGESMAPALDNGDWLIVDLRAYHSREPRAGDIVIARDPREPGRKIVKRVGAVTGGDIWLAGDNAAASTDSRTFGSIPVSAIAGRVRWRYWPRPGRMGRRG